MMDTVIAALAQKPTRTELTADGLRRCRTYSRGQLISARLRTINKMMGVMTNGHVNCAAVA